MLPSAINQDQRWPRVVGGRTEEFGRTLTRRHKELAALVARGRSNKECAAVLNISEGTVKVYLSAVFARLGISSRLELQVLFMERRADKWLLKHGKDLSPEAAKEFQDIFTEASTPERWLD